MVEEQWEQTVSELRDALVSGTNSTGVELQSETETSFGDAHLVTIVETAARDAETQIDAYTKVCALLDKRLTDGANQVLGFIVINGEPDPDALVTGLENMLRADGTFTPVLPLSEDQAIEIVSSGIGLLDIVDPATALIEIAASRSPITHDVAMTALQEIDELIERDT